MPTGTKFSLIFGLIVGTKLLEHEIRDPIQKKNAFGNNFCEFSIDFGVASTGTGGAFSLKNGWRLLTFLDLSCFLVPRGCSGRHFLDF